MAWHYLYDRETGELVSETDEDRDQLAGRLAEERPDLDFYSRDERHTEAREEQWSTTERRFVKGPPPLEE